MFNDPAKLHNTLVSSSTSTYVLGLTQTRRRMQCEGLVDKDILKNEAIAFMGGHSCIVFFSTGCMQINSVNLSTVVKFAKAIPDSIRICSHFGQVLTMMHEQYHNGNNATFFHIYPHPFLVNLAFEDIVALMTLQTETTLPTTIRSTQVVIVDQSVYNSDMPLLKSHTWDLVNVQGYRKIVIFADSPAAFRFLVGSKSGDDAMMVPINVIDGSLTDAMQIFPETFMLSHAIWGSSSFGFATLDADIESDIDNFMLKWHTMCKATSMADLADIVFPPRNMQSFLTATVCILDKLPDLVTFINCCLDWHKSTCKRKHVNVLQLKRLYAGRPVIRDIEVVDHTINYQRIYRRIVRFDHITFINILTDATAKVAAVSAFACFDPIDMEVV
jgi:hypothetical protein